MQRLVDESRLSAAGRRILQAILAERELMLRSRGRVRYISLSRLAQIPLVVLALGALGWAGFATASYFDLSRQLAERDQRIALALSVNETLRGQMDETKRRFLAIAGALEQNHDRLVSLVDQNRALKGNLVTMQKKLRETEQEHEAVQARSRFLRRQLSDLEDRVHEKETRNEALANDLTSTASRLNEALAEHSRERKRGKLLESRVARLQGRLASVSEAQRDLLKRLTKAAAGDVDRVRKLIAKTGLDVEELLAVDAKRDGGKEPGGEGGPLVPLGEGAGGPLIPLGGEGGPLIPLDERRMLASFDKGLDAFNAQMTRWQGVQGLVRRLPLVAPFRRYRVTSGFGKRRDPFTNGWAFHPGLDFAGPLHQRVLVTAPGRVVRAGWNGGYGRMVEVDHGFGIHTRYGHLADILVKRGQSLDFHDAVGHMGNSGRSTGPHLHYEILINGEEVDPMKFLTAGRHVFKG